MLYNVAKRKVLADLRATPKRVVEEIPDEKLESALKNKVQELHKAVLAGKYCCCVFRMRPQ